MILVDTNVLVYAAGSAHPLQEPCRRVIRAVGDGSLVATTTAQVIQEFCHVFGRRWGRARAVTLAAAYIDLLGPLHDVTTEAMFEALAWFADTDLDAADSLLAAVAFQRADGRVLSSDRSFDVLEERWVTPADLAAILPG